MALTKVSTPAIKDEAITLAKLLHGDSNSNGKFLRANNGADPSFETIDLTALSASNLTSGTLPDARFPATLPAVSAANLTSIPAGNLTGTVADARISALTASKFTGALPAIDGSNLTGITSTTINNNADNRIITGSGTANTLEGEANLTYNGTDLQLTTDANNEGIKIDGGTTYPVFEMTSNRSAGNTLGKVISKWNGTQIASINFVSGSDGTNKDDGYMAFLTSSAANISERMRVDSNGQLLVGTTQSSAYGNRQMAVGDASDSNAFVEIRTSSTGVGHLLFSRTAGASSGNYQGYIAYTQSSDHMSFHTGGGTQRARIDSDGLKFNADTAAANALNDYEEGTWTPANVDFDTYSSVTWDAKYTKIGNLVFINAEQTGGTIDFSTYDQLSGLPFSVDETGVGSWTTNGPAAGGEILIWDSETIYFAQNFSGPTNHRLRISGTYITNQ